MKQARSVGGAMSYMGERGCPMEGQAHPNVTAVQREMVFVGGKWSYILVIVTDLPLDPGDPDHDGKKINEMVTAVTKAQSQKAGYHSLVLRNA